MSVKLLIELNLVFLSLTGGCTGSSESTFVKMAHCWKSNVTVQIFLNTGPRMQSVTCLATDACLTACRSWCPEFDRSPVSYFHGD